MNKRYLHPGHWLVYAVLCCLTACQSLPDQTGKSVSHALTDVGDTHLATLFNDEIIKHPAQSGAHPLTTGADAFIARVELIQAAERTLDLQYYIWHKDRSGELLAGYLLEAAKRGVRVRLLLDDVGSPLGDDRLLMLSLQPNIEVRLFNPLANRSQRIISLITDFQRVNRRMHNKSLTADNTLSIVGGRNIGDEYFDADTEIAFADLDVMVVGPVVRDISTGFDLYWNSEHSFPIQRLSRRKVSEQELEHARSTTAASVSTAQQNLSASQAQDRLFIGKPIKWFWGKSAVFYDPPDKASVEKISTDELLATQLSHLFTNVKKELVLVSPYFIPGKKGVNLFRGLVDKGVDVSILTNSLAANDVVAVHSGYAKYRRKLLRAGVKLYEVPAIRSEEEKNKTPRYIGSSSRASLHAKAFFIDGEKTFVGSLNIDPRSIHINTEIGVVFESTEMTSFAAENIKKSLLNEAFKVELDENNQLVWLQQKQGETKRLTREPGASVWRKVSAWFISLLPIESQL